MRRTRIVRQRSRFGSPWNYTEVEELPRPKAWTWKQWQDNILGPVLVLIMIGAGAIGIVVALH